MKTFAEITKKFLKDKGLEDMIKCAYIHYVKTYEFNDIAYQQKEHHVIVLKENYSKEELKTFWKEMKFEHYGDNVVVSANIWLINNDFVHFDVLRDGEWKYIIIPKIPEECKRGNENAND